MHYAASGELQLTVRMRLTPRGHTASGLTSAECRWPPRLKTVLAVERDCKHLPTTTADRLSSHSTLSLPSLQFPSAFGNPQATPERRPLKAPDGGRPHLRGRRCCRRAKLTIPATRARIERLEDAQKTRLIALGCFCNAAWLCHSAQAPATGGRTIIQIHHQTRRRRPSAKERSAQGRNSASADRVQMQHC